MFCLKCFYFCCFSFLGPRHLYFNLRIYSGVDVLYPIQWRWLVLREVRGCQYLHPSTHPTMFLTSWSCSVFGGFCALVTLTEGWNSSECRGQVHNMAKWAWCQFWTFAVVMLSSQLCSGGWPQSWGRNGERWVHWPGGKVVTLLRVTVIPSPTWLLPSWDGGPFFCQISWKFRRNKVSGYNFQVSVFFIVVKLS